jgi:hypothetical protein
VSDRLPSWRPGRTRDAILAFLDGSRDVPVDERVAYIDNDGTMWCEKPGYVQLDFFVDALRQRTEHDPSLADRPEFAAVLSGDMAAVGEIGLAKVAGALAALFDGQTPEQFGAAVDEFLGRYRHRTLGVIVGALIGYDFGRDDAGHPVVRRTISQIGKANEGGAKLENIQSQIGRAPILAIGNSGGDREMLEWAQSNRHGGLAVLVNHDDAEREFAYESQAATFKDDEPITQIADRLGWVVVSMQRDWKTIFAAARA